jgi:hypothetical protein
MFNNITTRQYLNNAIKYVKFFYVDSDVSHGVVAFVLTVPFIATNALRYEEYQIRLFNSQSNADQGQTSFGKSRLKQKFFVADPPNFNTRPTLPHNIIR